MFTFLANLAPCASSLTLAEVHRARDSVCYYSLPYIEVFNPTCLDLSFCPDLFEVPYYCFFFFVLSLSIVYRPICGL